MKGTFIPRLLRTDRKEEIKTRKLIAARQVRWERLQNEEQIRMNQTNYLFNAISRREKWLQHQNARKIVSTDQITQQIDRITKAV